MPDLFKRAITGLIFVLVLTWAIIYGKNTQAFLFCVISLLGVNEFYNITKKGGYSPWKIPGLLLSGTIYLIINHQILNVDSTLLFTIIILLFVSVFLFEIKSKKPNFLNIGVTLIGVIYWTVPISLATYISNYTGTYDWQPLMGFFILLWCNDTGAYLVGSKIGKRRIAPLLSPKKSWEGYFGGGLIALAGAYVVSLFFTSLSMSQWMSIGVIVFLLATPGDLVESMIKRNYGVKDSGVLLPGHGGVLDRFDGAVLTLPVILSYLLLVS